MMGNRKITNLVMASFWVVVLQGSYNQLTHIISTTHTPYTHTTYTHVPSHTSTTHIHPIYTLHTYIYTLHIHILHEHTHKPRGGESMRE